MGKYGITFRPDRSYVLSKVSQEQIMSYYLGIPVDIGVLYRSPLRNDNNPTCGFAYSNNGNLMFRDFSGHFWGDCFDVVMYVRNCNFADALNHICTDMALIKRMEIPEELLGPRIPKTRKTLGFRKRTSWSEVDKEFWKSYHISSKTLRKFHVSPMYMGFINDEVCYRYRDSDPGYAFWLRTDSNNTDRIKFYFPYRDRTMTRFMGNCGANDLFGYDNLPPKGDLLIITKSLKDVMVLYELGIPSIAVQAESMVFDRNIFTDLASRFKRIITLFDFDHAGVRLTNIFRKLYSTGHRFLTDGRFGSLDYGAKDISDYIRSWGPKYTLSLIRINI
jgi:hypothetical protein